ncbi:MAG TPA: NAD(P)/FAD-dependent oxidoreductase, partial [Solirubrobacterales bacterium]|nr:NAD(P)/FAD-dependent oxidoreductase [Solirubrobacterales bacterium]
MGGRTPLARRLGEAAAIAAREASAEEALAEPSPGMRRRELLAGGAGLAAAAMLSGPVSRALAATAPRVVVVGGGLAGLTCAYRLKQSGLNAQLYEASDRLGGRCWTRRGDFAEGQIAEHGGELIDQGHTEIRKLAKELGLELDNLLAAEANGAEAFYYFDGKPYSFEEATNDLKGIWQQIHKDVSAASYPTLYNSNTERGRELDAMSIADWIKAYVPGGLKSKLGQLLDVAYNIEYGAETSVQSSLNMLYLLGYSGQGQLRIFGPSNEKYHVRGGNDQIPKLLAAELKGQITKERALTSISRNADGSYRLAFASGLSTETVIADHVVLALPFSILRTLDYSGAGFSSLKKTAIEEMGMGTNSKLHLQFKDRLWNSLDCNGETYADTGYQNTWEVSRGQSGSTGLLVDYTGGNIGASFGSGTPTSRAQQFLGQIEPLLPGATANWNGNATIDFWAGNPYTKG